MRTVDDVLRMAKSAGVTVLVEGYDLVLEHEADPPANLVAMLRHYKPELVSALRMRQAEQRSLITQWINNHFTSSTVGVCVHCGAGERAEDPFVLLFVGNDRGEVHASCHPSWLVEREAEARRALGLAVDAAEEMGFLRLKHGSAMTPPLPNQIPLEVAPVPVPPAPSIPPDAGGPFSVNQEGDRSL